MSEESRIAAAAGAAVTKQSSTGKMMEAAMAEAVEQCLREGITDPEEIKKRKTEARERVKLGTA